jgi:hypothetical protein
VVAVLSFTEENRVEGMSDIGFAALRQVEQGLLDRALAGLQKFAPGPERTAWQAAIQAHCHLADPVRFALPTWSLASSDLDTNEAAAVACVAFEKAALLSLDPPAFASALSIHRSLAGRDIGTEGTLWLLVANAWASYLGLSNPDRLEATASMEQVRLRAGELKLAALVVESTVLIGLLALSGGMQTDARTLLRRAALMAQSEALPQSQYLAHLALARLRRYERRPHLAARILGSLRKVAPSSWRAWLDWESVLSGLNRMNNDASPAVRGPAQWLEQGLVAATAGDRERFLKQMSQAKESLAGWADLQGELQTVQGCLDPLMPIDTLPQDVRAWVQGQGDLIPRGVDSIVFGRNDPELTVACVFAAPTFAPRRLLSAGSALLGENFKGALPRVQRNNARIETAAAALALAGSAGLDEAEMWRRVYGFQFVIDLHRGTLEVLIHRLRERWGDTAKINRREGGFCFQPEVPMFIVDPRGMPSVDALILKLFSERGTASARAAADALVVPLRTVQTALAELVAEGHLRVEGKGRSVSYVLEDTVFAEPTQV